MADLTLAMAERAVSAAQAKAREIGTPITVTVVDEAGRLVLCARGDGTAFLTPETSRGKAVAAAAFRRSTKEMVELAREHPRSGMPCPRSPPDSCCPAGCLPISKDGRVIGAIGCGGGTGEQDHQCALAGAATV